MSKTMSNWFFMRPGFDTFNLEPKTHRQFVFGSKDRQRRDIVLGSLEEATFSKEGHKAAVYGDFGQGKTHQCYNIMYQIERRGLDLAPFYIRCPAYQAKEPFGSLFSEFLKRLKTEDLNRIAKEYQRRVQEGEATALAKIVDDEDIDLVMSQGLSVINLNIVKASMQWLGGVPKVDMRAVDGGLKPQLTDSTEFAAVMRGIAHMFITVEGKVPVFLIDECEYLKNITHTDTFYKWLAALRELTELRGVGLIFLIGARGRNDLPVLFVQPEIMRRIGVANYVEFMPPGKDELEEFLYELLDTAIRKGKVPEAQREFVDPAALDETVPEELQQVTAGEAARLRTFPLDVDALSEFIQQLTAGDLTSKPSEVLKRLQKCAQRAMRYDKRTITLKIVETIGAEGM